MSSTRLIWEKIRTRLHELQEKETAYFHKEIGYKAVLTDGTDDDLSEREANRDLEQQEIDNAVPLTEDEQAEKTRLSELGFSHWNRRDFQQFVNGSAKFGRTDYDGISTEVDSKTPQEVKEYAKVFWERYDEINDYTKYIRVVEQGEEKLRKSTHQRKMLRKKLDMYRVPLQQLKINYTVSTTNKKVYSEEEDRFLLVMLDKLGKEDDSEGFQLFERMREEIRDSPLFRFDWFFLSRTPVELSRRCTTLLNTIAREFEPETKPNGDGKGRVRERGEYYGEEDEEEAPAKKKSKNGVVVVSAFLMC